MKPEDHEAMRKAWQDKTSGLNYHDFQEGFECGLAHRDAQPAVAVNEQMLDVLKFIQRGMERNHIKAKPFLDFSNPNAESLELQHPLTLVNAAIAAAEQQRRGD